MADTTAKEWLRVTHTGAGITTATVTLVEESLSVKWAVKTYSSTIKSGIASARAGARRAMDELKAALEDVE